MLFQQCRRPVNWPRAVFARTGPLTGVDDMVYFRAMVAMTTANERDHRPSDLRSGECPICCCFVRCMPASWDLSAGDFTSCPAGTAPGIELIMSLVNDCA